MSHALRAGVFIKLRFTNLPLCSGARLTGRHPPGQELIEKRRTESLDTAEKNNSRGPKSFESGELLSQNPKQIGQKDEKMEHVIFKKAGRDPAERAP